MPSESKQADCAIPLGELSPCRRAAWAALYRKHYRSLVCSLKRIGGELSLQDCEDAAQQAFMEFWQRPCEDRTEAATVAYLLRAASSRLMDQLRKHAAQRRRPAHVSSSEEFASDSVATFWVRETEERVRWAVSQLPPEQREVIEWMDLRGLTAAELAQRLACNPDTLRSRRRRAKAALFHALRDNRGCEPVPLCKKNK
jgi:RNA polymerase sigma-70 factor (ECF subfamily)